MTNKELHELIDQEAVAALRSIHRVEYEEIKRVIFASISTVLNTNGIALTGKPSFVAETRGSKN